MFKHQNFFWSFLKKIIKNGFLESIKITQSSIFKENVEEQSMKSAVDLWSNILNRDKIFSDFTLSKTFNQIMNEISEVVQTLNINYKEVRDVVKVNSDNIEMNDNKNLLSQTNTSNLLALEIKPNDIYYEAEDLNDLEIFNRICLFLKEFLSSMPRSQYKYFDDWNIIFINNFMQCSKNSPRVGSCYIGLTVILFSN